MPTRRPPSCSGGWWCLGKPSRLATCVTRHGKFSSEQLALFSSFSLGARAIGVDSAPVSESGDVGGRCPPRPRWAGLRPPRPPASDALSFPLAQLDAFVWQ